MVAGSNGGQAETGQGQSPRSVRGLSSALLHRLSGLSALLDRSIFASRAGLTFDGRRDVQGALGYARALTAVDYRRRYERGGVAERIVEAYPRATWGGGADVIEDPDVDVQTPFESAVSRLNDNLDMWSKLLRVDILAQLGEFSCLLIGAPGDFTTELPRLTNPDSVLYLTALGQDKVTITRVVDDKTDRRFNRPYMYQVRLGTTSLTATPTTTDAGIGQSSNVHWSRIVHVAEGTLEDDIHGKPRLRACWNYLDDLDKLVGGGSEAAWKRMDPGIHADYTPPPGTLVDVPQEELDKLASEIEDYQHGLSREIYTRGVKLDLLSSNVADFGRNSNVVIQLISATTGIPYRILSGSERGELASTQDRNNWADRVGERRREFAVPLVRMLLQRLLDYGALPQPKQYEVVWPETDELNDIEKATMVGQLALANANQAKSGDSLILSSDEIRDRTWGLAPYVPVVDPNAADNGGTTSPDSGVSSDNAPPSETVPPALAAEV